MDFSLFEKLKAHFSEKKPNCFMEVKTNKAELDLTIFVLNSSQKHIHRARIKWPNRLLNFRVPTDLMKVGRGNILEKENEKAREMNLKVVECYFNRSILM